MHCHSRARVSAAGQRADSVLPLVISPLSGTAARRLPVPLPKPLPVIAPKGKAPIVLAQPKVIEKPVLVQPVAVQPVVVAPVQVQPVYVQTQAVAVAQAQAVAVAPVHVGKGKGKFGK